MKITFVFFCLLFLASAFAANESQNVKKHWYFVSTYHKTHWLPQLELAKTLFEQGHKITFQIAEEFEGTSENPSKEELSFTNINIAPIGFTPSQLQNVLRNATLVPMTDFTGQLSVFKDLATTMVSGQSYALEEILELNKYEKIDVVVADMNHLGASAACKILDIQCFYTSPFLLRNPDSEILFFGSKVPSWLPATITGKNIQTTFSGRIEQGITLSLTKLVFNYALPYFYDSSPFERIISNYNLTMNDFVNTIHPHLINSFEGLDWSIPIPPHIKYIGPVNFDAIQEKRTAVLEKHSQYPNGKYSFSDLDRFLESADDIILISFGKSVELTYKQTKEIIDFITMIQPAKVVWTIRERHLHLLDSIDIPSNLRIETWINLIEVMAHPHISILISQCGIATLHEAILTETPVLCVPFLFDQFDNSAIALHRGIGEQLARDDLTGKNLVDVIEYMINNKQYYQENCQKLIEIGKLHPKLIDVINWMETILTIGEEHILPAIDSNSLWFYEYNEIFYIFILTSLFIMFLFGRCTKQNRKINKQKID